MKNILVALDLAVEDADKKLVYQAYRLAEKFASKVWLVHTYSTIKPEIVTAKLQQGNLRSV